MNSLISFLKTRKFRYFFAPLAALWLIWFGLNKYFSYQGLKQYPIANPIPAVPLSDDYYRLKHEADIKENVGRAATLQSIEEQNARARDSNRTTYGLEALQNFSSQDDLPALRELFFYSPDPLFNGGGWLVESPTDPIREGLKYCRIPFAHDVYGRGSYDYVKSKRVWRNLDPDDQHQDFTHFQDGENPCIQYENLIVNWGGTGRIGVLRPPETKQPHGENRFYLTFPGYIYGHTNNFDDYKEFIYSCTNARGDKNFYCKLLGYDQEMESLYRSRPFSKGHEYDYNNPYYVPSLFQLLLMGWLLWMSIKTFIQYRKSKQKESVL